MLELGGDFFILETVNSQKPFTTIPLLKIPAQELTMYLQTPPIQKSKWVCWLKRKHANQSPCFIISDIMLTFQWSYNLISSWTLRQHCLPFVKTLIYTLPSKTGPWATAGTHCSNITMKQSRFLFRKTSTREHTFHRYTLICNELTKPLQEQ